MKFDVVATVTDQIIAAMESGIAMPWVKEWDTDMELVVPKNIATGKRYKGINFLSLLVHQRKFGYTSQQWGTFKQWSAKGGSLKGASGTGAMVIYSEFKEVQKTKDGVAQFKDGKPLMTVIRIWKYSTVFNRDVVQGIESEPVDALRECTESEPIVEDAILAYANRAKLKIVHRHDDIASYNQADHMVKMPEMGQFNSVGAYYSTLFHELAHSTGHETLLDRFSNSGPMFYGNESYAQEELLAEMASCFAMVEFGLRAEPMDANSTAYLAGWAKALKANPSMLAKAASGAERAVACILGSEGPATAA